VTSIRGSLSETGFPAVVRPIVRHRKTGVLRCTRGPILRTVYVSDGRLIFATSTDPDDRLGEILLAKGIISYRVYDDSVRALRAGKRQGTILVEGGAISSRDLIEGVTDQVRNIINSLVAWEDGEYEFTEGDLPSREVITLRISTGDLLMEGIRRVQRWSRIRTAVGAVDQVYAPNPASSAVIAGMSLDKDELAMIANIDGATTVEEICRTVHRPDYWVCRTIWGLWAVGILDRLPEDLGDRGTKGEKTEPHAEGLRGFAVGREIERFNQLHRFVFELVRYQLREEAPAFFEQAFSAIVVEIPALFDGVAVDPEGEFDPIALRRNIVTGEVAGYMRGFDRLLEVEVDLARTMFGERKAGIILDGILALKEQQLKELAPAT
jgi:hypothetical protein